MWSKSLWISRILVWEPFNLWIVITWWGIKVSFSTLKKRRYSRYYRQYFRLDWVVCHPNTNKSSWLTTSWYCHDWVPKDTTLVKITTKNLVLATIYTLFRFKIWYYFVWLHLHCPCPFFHNCHNCHFDLNILSRRDIISILCKEKTNKSNLSILVSSINIYIYLLSNHRFAWIRNYRLGRKIFEHIFFFIHLIE